MICNISQVVDIVYGDTHICFILWPCLTGECVAKLVSIQYIGHTGTIYSGTAMTLL